MLTKDDFKQLEERFATKDDLKKLSKELRDEFATKKDMEQMRDQIIQVIVDQVSTLTSMIGDSSTEVQRSRRDIDTHEATLTAHEVRIDKLEQMI
jgi:DNA repair ATPase RecN